MDTYVLAMQAYAFRWIGFLALAYGLYCGYDPFFVCWRAALAALLGMLIIGFLMRRVVRIMSAHVLAEQRAQAEQESADAEGSTNT